MDAGDEHQHLDAPPTIYLDKQGRYLDEQGRPDSPDAGDETATLLGFLERQRATFAWKCAGLGTAGLRATSGASSMTLGGMLKHLARFEDDMSSEWLRGREQRPPWNTVDWDADHDRDWRSAAADTPGQLYALGQDAVARSRTLVAEALADGGREQRGGGIADARGALPSLRYILINMPDHHDRGVRAAQRPCRPHPGVGGRARRARSAGVTARAPRALAPLMDDPCEVRGGTGDRRASGLRSSTGLVGETSLGAAICGDATHPA